MCDNQYRDWFSHMPQCQRRGPGPLQPGSSGREPQDLKSEFVAGGQVPGPICDWDLKSRPRLGGRVRVASGPLGSV